MLTPALLLSCLMSGTSVFSDAAVTARGTVFEDVNQNIRRDAGEPGIAGVLVTNGIDVVPTGKDGTYEIGVDADGAIVSVVKPRGFDTARDRQNLPRFYYIHRPQGSPDAAFVYPGVAPTGPLPESIDFGLTRAADPERFDVVVVADPQPYSEQEVSFYGRDVVAELAGVDAAFAVALGDLVGDNLDLFEPYNQMNALTGHRWHNVYGNHDMNFVSPTDEYAAETFHRVYGPTDYAFSQGRSLFIVLDNVHWNGFDGFRKDGRPKNGNYVGRVSDRQVEFVRNLLAHTPEDHLVVVCTHIPLMGAGERESTENLAALLGALSTHPRTLSLSGHTHVQRQFFLGSEHGYTPAGGGEHHHYNAATASGTWWKGPLDERGIPHAMMRDGAPNGYAILSVDGADYSIAYKAAGYPADYQMNIHAPDEAVGGEDFLVNVFNGSERCTTEFRIAGLTQWTPMTYQPQIDPGYADLAEVDRASGRPRPLNQPAESTHIWAASLPAALPAGTHWLEVRSTDLYGKESISRRPVRVQPQTEAAAPTR